MAPKQKIKQSLGKFRQAFFREKYRFDQGNAFLVFVNFSLLVYTLLRLTENDTRYLFLFIIIGFFSTWSLGYFLDKVVRIQEIQEKISLERSPIWQEAFAYHSRHQQKLEKLTDKLERLEKRFESKLEEENIVRK